MEMGSPLQSSLYSSKYDQERVGRVAHLEISGLCLIPTEFLFLWQIQKEPKSSKNILVTF